MSRGNCFSIWSASATSTNRRKIRSRPRKSRSVNCATTRPALTWTRIGITLDAIGLQFYNPRAHHLLGIALHRIGRVPRAIEALRVCVRQNPNLVKAHERLAYIYEKRIGNPDEAQRHKDLARQARENIRKQKEGTATVISKDTRPTIAAADIAEPATAAAPMNTPLADTAVVVTGLPRSGTASRRLAEPGKRRERNVNRCLP